MAGAVAQYGGAAVAVGLFDQLAAAGVAWLRVAWSAVILLAWRRPWRRQLGRRDDRARWRHVAAFGVALAAMNLCFYLAIARLPLGTAVAIEFSGPIAVAAFGARSRRAVTALLLAAGGVVLLADVQWQASPAGVGFALAAAALWAAYIVLGAGATRTARRAAGRHRHDGFDGLNELSVASGIGALAIAPVGLPPAISASASVIALCAVVGLLSNVVPYALDQLVFPRLGPSQFALLSTLLPATAALTGALVLGQVPTAVEAGGVGLVVAAVAVGQRRS